MDRRTFLATLTGGLLAAPRAAGAQEPEAVPSSLWPPSGLFLVVVLLLIAGVVFLLLTGILASVSSRRRRRKLAKTLVPLAAGSVCAALWILLVNTAVGATSKVTSEPAMLGLGGVMVALIVASLLWRPNRLRTVVRLSVMAIGFHSLALPIAALISIVAAGSRTVNPHTVALSVGGLLSGVFLVFVGDRVLRRRSRPRARFDLSRPRA